MGGSISNITHDQNKSQQDYNINAKVDYIGDKDSVSLNWLSYRDYIENQDALIYNNNQTDTPATPDTTTQGNILYATNKFIINPAWQWNSQVMYLTDKNTGKFHGITPLELDQNSLLLQNNFSYLKYFIGGFDLQKSNYHNYSQSIQVQEANEKSRRSF
ncbi:hypothetical protein [Piscirickettsia litoralis]|uniref:TonB-dependent receptor-like beta-barrel domain-containing protein n=1 Tax=Piscirickettsia litoralis TaxID=1891921 RepID=A0ABX3A3S8_9GAMM|nr:hypothetical protein [Piscirickettsia litoralis]ODN43526.1 hypothetical protein BGC07_12110 [Piscirickettsia litoralis]